ncbi:MAG TPA: hypothetical protein VKR53_17240 [Puia sp.]|nr:hypothetical protein [Puia sp.]
MRLTFWGLVAVLCGTTHMLYSQPVTPFPSDIRAAEFRYTVAGNTLASNVPLNEISARAFRHFSRNYSFAVSEKWTKITNGIVVSFIRNSKNYRIAYTKKGNFLFSLVYYQGSECSDELMSMIARTYPGFHIKNATELFDGNKLIFGLMISNGELNRSLEYRDGRIRILEEYTSQ